MLGRGSIHESRVLTILKFADQMTNLKTQMQRLYKEDVISSGLFSYPKVQRFLTVKHVLCSFCIPNSRSNIEIRQGLLSYGIIAILAQL